MGRKHPDEPQRPFPWRKALRNAGVKSTENALLAAGTTTVTAPEPITVATVAAIAFSGTAAFSLAGEYLNHRVDDPLPVFDARTTLLFDTVGIILGFLLFVMPALNLDHAMNPSMPLPGWFGYMALFLTGFLVTVSRGLICNFGLAREIDDRRESIS